MIANPSNQKLLIQLETALHRLVESFWEEPYRTFTKRDAVAALQTWVARRPDLTGVYRTADGFETGLLHRAYPTASRPGGRGGYDLAVLHPDLLQRRDAQTIAQGRMEPEAVPPGPPLVAAVQFWLFSGPWEPDQEAADSVPAPALPGRCPDLVRQDLALLARALAPPAQASAAYLCVLCRDPTPEPGPLEVYGEELAGLLGEFPEVRAVAALCWPQARRAPFVHYAGLWITGDAGGI